METYVLIELVKESRLLGILAKELPQVGVSGATPGLILGDQHYLISARWDFANWLTTTGSYEGADKLWELVRNLVDTPEEAMALLESVESIGYTDAKPVCTVNDQGEPTGLTVPGSGVLRCVTYLQAISLSKPDSLRELAKERLAAKSAAAAIATSDEESGTAAGTDSELVIDCSATFSGDAVAGFGVEGEEISTVTYSGDAVPALGAVGEEISTVVTEVQDWSKVSIVGPYANGDTLKPGQRVASLPKELAGTFAWEFPGEEIVLAQTGDLVVVVDSKLDSASMHSDECLLNEQ